MEFKWLKVLQYGSDLSFEVWSHLKAKWVRYGDVSTARSMRFRIVPLPQWIYQIAHLFRRHDEDQSESIVKLPILPTICILCVPDHR